MIYDYFEIIKEETIKLLLDIYQKGTQNYLECFFGERKVIINYEKKLGNKKYVYIIGKLDNDNTFINEYILIYDDYPSSI